MSGAALVRSHMALLLHMMCMEDSEAHIDLEKLVDTNVSVSRVKLSIQSSEGHDRVLCPLEGVKSCVHRLMSTVMRAAG